MELFGHGVITIAAPRMAPEYALHRQIESKERAMLLDCLHGIGTTCRRKSTGSRSKGRNAGSIEIDRHQQQHGNAPTEEVEDPGFAFSFCLIA